MTTRKDLEELLLVTADAADELGYSTLAADLRHIVIDPSQGPTLAARQAQRSQRRVPLYEAISNALAAWQNSRAASAADDEGTRENALEWMARHRERIEHLVSRRFPSGAGFDNGTTFDLEGSTPDHLIFSAPYHVMNEAGYYVGWRDVEVHVRPSLSSGFELRVRRAGRDLGDYVHEVFDDALRQYVDAYEE